MRRHNVLSRNVYHKRSRGGCRGCRGAPPRRRKKFLGIFVGMRQKWGWIWWGAENREKILRATPTVCMFVCYALSFESLTEKVHFWSACAVHLRKISYRPTTIIGSRSRSEEQKASLCVLFSGDLPRLKGSLILVFDLLLVRFVELDFPVIFAIVQKPRFSRTKRGTKDRWKGVFVAAPRTWHRLPAHLITHAFDSFFPRPKSSLPWLSSLLPPFPLAAKWPPEIQLWSRGSLLIRVYVILFVKFYVCDVFWWPWNAYLTARSATLLLLPIPKLLVMTGSNKRLMQYYSLACIVSRGVWISVSWEKQL